MRLKILHKYLTILVVILMIGTTNDGLAVSLFKEVDALLKRRIEAIGIGPNVTIKGEKLDVADGLPDFYRARNYAPAWTDDFGVLPHALSLVRAIQQSDREGLRPEDYWYPQIVKMLKATRQRRPKRDLLQPPVIVDLELLLANAFLTYGSHLLHGKLDPQKFHPAWIVNLPDPSLSAELQNAIDKERVPFLLKSLKSTQSGYLALRKALAAYRRIENRGGWPAIPKGPTLREGSSGPRILKLRSRLRVTGDIKPAKEKALTPELFDIGLTEAVINFQSRHGLSADGVIGPATLAVLRIPVEEQITRIEINLERMRWLPKAQETDHLLVNIPDHTLKVLNTGQIVTKMSVVVGRPERHTPILKDQVTDVVFNPHWYVPPTILKHDLLPRVKENPDYLKNLKIRVLQPQDGEAWELDTATIDWDQLDKFKPPLQFRQDAGPENFLGRFKFILSNELDIYLHDTSYHAQFKGHELNLSSGCIRLEDPMHLADYLLKNDPYWDAERITRAVASGAPRKVTLSEPFPVYVVYWTAWVDINGIVQFRPDIYDFDGAVIAALSR